MNIPSFHDPILSRAQSALHQALVRLEEPATNHLSAQHPSMLSLVNLGNTFSQPGITDQDILARSGIFGECVTLYYLYCKADFEHNAEQAAYYKGLILKGSCDAGYVEAVLGYEETKNHIQYTALQPGQGIYNTLPENCTIALLADWATGATPALSVLQQAVAQPSQPAGAQKPNLLIHLGDVYYAGSVAECTDFFVTAVTNAVPGAFTSTFPVYAIPGNHEYYWGADGFVSSIRKATGQEGSYWCLRNSAWQIVALDTGYNDRDPFTVTTNTTYLPADQVAWLADVMSSGLPTILLTHHQLYSAVSSVGADTTADPPVLYGINQKLHDQIAVPYGSQIVVWLWGHEHNTVIFNPQAGLPVGRCIGSGGIPMLLDQYPYRPNAALRGLPGIPVPTINTRYELAAGEFEYNHGFATIALTPQNATVTYYQVPQATPTTPAGAAVPLGPSEVYTHPNGGSGASGYAADATPQPG
jgi:hypothetical protein